MRIGIIGDIHEDIVALKEALKIIETRNCDRIICLGDIIGYKVNRYNFLDTRNATECIAMVKANCSEVVIGNNDLYQIKKNPEHNPVFDFPADWFELDYFEKKKLAKDKIFLYDDVELRALITKSDAEYLHALPEFVVGDYDGFKILISHFAFPDPTGQSTYYPKTANEFHGHLAFMKINACTIGFSGHMHFEGVSICSYDSVTRNDFGTISLSQQTQWLYGPCITRGRFRNGFMIFDTKNMELESVPLHMS